MRDRKFSWIEGEGVSRNSVKIFCLIAKIFVVDPLSLSLSSGIEKISCLRGSGLSFELVFSDSALIFSRGTLLCFRKCQLTKYLMPKRVVSRILVKSLLSQNTKKLRRGTFLCPKKCWYRKTLWIRGGRECQQLLSNFFVSVPKNFAVDPLSLSLYSGMEKKICLRGLDQGFPSKLFCLTVPKYFVEEPFFVAESFGYRKCFWIKAGSGITILCRSILSHCTKLFHRITLLCFRTVRVTENFMPTRKISRFPCRKFVVSQYRKTSYREPFCVLEKCDIGSFHG